MLTKKLLKCKRPYYLIRDFINGRKVDEKTFNLIIDMNINHYDIYEELFDNKFRYLDSYNDGEIIYDDSNFIFKDVAINVYKQYPELFLNLLLIKRHVIDLKRNNINCLNADFVEKWGKDIIANHPDLLIQFDYKTISNHSDIIKSNIKYLELLNKNMNPDIIDKFLTIAEKDNNLEKYIEVINGYNYCSSNDIKNELGNKYKDLISIYLDNYNNENLQRIIHDYPSYLGKVAYFYDKKLKSVVDILFDFNQSLPTFILEAHNDKYPLTDKMNMYVGLLEKIDSQELTKDNAVDILTEALVKIIESGYYQLHDEFEWGKKYSAYQINNAINVKADGQKTNSKKYKYEDKNGQEVVVEIPTIELNDPNFACLITHIVDKRDGTELEEHRVSNAVFGSQLMTNPQLWDEYYEDKSSFLSLSYYSKNVANLFYPDNKGVILGFNSIPEESLVLSNDRDASSPMKKEFMIELHENITTIDRIKEVAQATKLYAKQSVQGYNEIAIKRYKDKKPLIPNYVLNITNLDYMESNQEAICKWTSHYNIPVVEIDARRMKLLYEENYYNLIKNLNNADFTRFNDDTPDVFMKEYIDPIFYARALMEIFTDESERNNYLKMNFMDFENAVKYHRAVPTLFDTVLKITEVLDLNKLEHAKVIYALLNDYDRMCPKNDDTRRKEYNTYGFEIAPTADGNYVDHRIYLNGQKYTHLDVIMDSIKNQCAEVIEKYNQEESKGL